MKKVTPILISFFMVLILALGTITRPLALSTTKIIPTSEKETTSYLYNNGNGVSAYAVSLYYDENTPITMNWLIEHPKYRVELSSDSSGTLCVFTENTGVGGLSVQFSNSTILSSELVQSTYDKFIETYPSVCNKPILFAPYNHNATLNIQLLSDISDDSSGTGTGSGDTTTEGDGTTTEDDDSGLFQSIKEFFSGLFEDIPTWIDNAVSSIGEFFSQIPIWISNAVDSIGEFFANLITKIGEFFSDVGEWIANAVKDIGEFFSLVGEWIGNAVTSIVEFIGDFFTDLFEPILGWFENKRAEEETKQSFWEKMNEGLNKILDKIMGFTLVPIRDFFNNLVNSDVVFVLNEIYEFPIIKEMIILVVAVLVILGVLGLLLTY